MDMRKLREKSKRYGHYDNHKLIRLLKEQSFEKDNTKDLKIFLNKIGATEVGKQVLKVKVNKYLKRFAELMLTQLNIKKMHR